MQLLLHKTYGFLKEIILSKLTGHGLMKKALEGICLLDRTLGQKCLG